MRPDRRLLIDGKLTEGERSFPTLNPATGQVLGHAPDATVADAEAAVGAARRGREMGTAGFEEFLERKAFALPVA